MRTLVLLLLLGILPTLVQARVISGIEHWQGEVRLDEPLRVESGAQLMIAPGTKVIATAKIEVAGQLQADEVDFSGRDWPGLVLKGTDARTYLSNCRLSGARTAITILGGAPQLTALLLENNRIGIEVRQKSQARLVDSVFRNNSRVGLFLKDEAIASVTGNRFEHQGKFGAYIYRAKPREFAGNLFIDNQTGLMISHFGSNPLIEKNEFRQNGTGIKVDRTARPEILGNTIEQNQVGIKLYRRSDPLIQRNRFQQNQQAIHISFSSYPRIRHNDFIRNTRALVLEFQSSAWEASKGAAARQRQIVGQGAFGGQKQDQVTEEQRKARNLNGTVDARENWWGTAETRELTAGEKGMNLPWIDDGLDTPTFEEGGKNYPLDRVQWTPFSPVPFTSKENP